MCYVERSLHVRLPEVLAAKLDRFVEAQGMTQSELVRLALRSYFASTVNVAAETISREIQRKLAAAGVNENNVEEWYKSERRKNKQHSKDVKASA
jgi:metal-responsive CopG/Arc/MetJ family transcriptional regulator